MRLLLATALLLGSLPAVAAERCDVPKTEDGCYEVYGKDADGKRVEFFFTSAGSPAAARPAISATIRPAVR
ncbi:MAG: PepSY domain-containing protein [Amaricoccus sp.]|uniref:PepSY domain-containing protein n=1 Tax=Amaricoccus sp. TaxID=1872485 RepID=UPI0039E467F8